MAWPDLSVCLFLQFKRTGSAPRLSSPLALWVPSGCGTFIQLFFVLFCLCEVTFGFTFLC